MAPLTALYQWVQQAYRDMQAQQMHMYAAAARAAEAEAIKLAPEAAALRLRQYEDQRNLPIDHPPISILLHHAVQDLAARAGSSSTSSLKFWLLRLISTREKHMENRPFASLSALEDYAEHTYATLMYMTLAAMPLQSVQGTSTPGVFAGYGQCWAKAALEANNRQSPTTRLIKRNRFTKPPGDFGEHVQSENKCYST